MRIEIVNEHATDDRDFVFATGSYIDADGDDVGTITLSAGVTLILNFDQLDDDRQQLRNHLVRNTVKTETVAYTVVAADLYKKGLSYIKADDAITFPDGVASASNVGSQVSIMNTSATNTTITLGGSVTNIGPLTIEPNRVVTITVTGANTIDVIGGV